MSSATALNSAALFAHHIAGGNTVSGTSLLSSLLVLVSISLLFSHSCFEGPRLGLLILLSQLFTHIVLGSNSGNSTSMVISHIVSGFLVYVFIARTDQSILWLSSTFVPIIFRALGDQYLLGNSFRSIDDAGYSLSRRFEAFQYWTTSPPLVAKFS